MRLRRPANNVAPIKTERILLGSGTAIEVRNGFALSSQNISGSFVLEIEGVGGWFVTIPGSLKTQVETSRTTVLYAAPSIRLSVVSKIRKPKRTGNPRGSESPRSVSRVELI